MYSQSVLQWYAGWFGVLMDFIKECKITPGMELFEQKYFTEQYCILTRIEKGHENWKRTKLTYISFYRTHVDHKAPGI